MAKDIRKQRVINDFVKSAQEILRSEGLEGISARKVAEKAGWSYATIYNYFNDINHLLWHCIPAFISEINQYIISRVGDEADGLGQLRKAHKAYVQYFLERPNIYRFMFLTDIGPPPPDLAKNLAEPVLGRGQEQVLRRCVQQGLIREEDIPIVGELIVVAVNGALYMQATGKIPTPPEQLLDRVDVYISYVFKKEGKGNESS